MQGNTGVPVPYAAYFTFIFLLFLLLLYVFCVLFKSTVFLNIGMIENDIFQ